MQLALRWLACVLGLAVFAASGPSEAVATDLSAAKSRAQMMGQVKSWAYQLQRLDMAALAASPFDLLVIDHAPDRVESVELLFRRSEIEPLKTKADGSRRLVLAYVSIGEAERYRFYWDEAWRTGSACPAWLGPANPQWAGNYPVEYWQPAWQQIVFGATDSYVDRVLAAGFDGIYIDRADVYEQVLGRPGAKADMVAFLARLIDHARAEKPDAIVVLQNAEELVRVKDVRMRIDGVAKESLYFNPDTSGGPTLAAERTAAEADLRLAKKAGRAVMVVEYVDRADQVAAARRQAGRDGFMLHFAERTLSVLNVSDPPRPASDPRRPVVEVKNAPQLARPSPCG